MPTPHSIHACTHPCHAYRILYIHISPLLYEEGADLWVPPPARQYEGCPSILYHTHTHTHHIIIHTDRDELENTSTYSSSRRSSSGGNWTSYWKEKKHHIHAYTHTCIHMHTETTSRTHIRQYLSQFVLSQHIHHTTVTLSARRSLWITSKKTLFHNLTLPYYTHPGHTDTHSNHHMQVRTGTITHHMKFHLIFIYWRPQSQLSSMQCGVHSWR
jgi:hypothetical protein